MAGDIQLTCSDCGQLTWWPLLELNRPGARSKVSDRTFSKKASSSKGTLQTAGSARAASKVSLNPCSALWQKSQLNDLRKGSRRNPAAFSLSRLLQAVRGRHLLYSFRGTQLATAHLL